MTANRTTGKGGQRYYSWRGERYWSVTTIIDGGLPKRALIYWAANEVADFACDNLPEIQAFIDRDERDVAYDVLKRAPWRKKEKAAALGTNVHDAIEAYMLGKPFPAWPDTIRPRMLAFEQFLAEHQPEYHATEAPIYNRSQRYAGTLDAIVTVKDGRRLLIDAKSSKAIYPDVALQLAAYRHAEFIGLPDGSEAAMQEVDGCAALHLAEDGSWAFPTVRADQEVFRAFLYVREVFRWVEETSKTVLRFPDQLPLEEALAGSVAAAKEA